LEKGSPVLNGFITCTVSRFQVNISSLQIVASCEEDTTTPYPGEKAIMEISLGTEMKDYPSQ